MPHSYRPPLVRINHLGRYKSAERKQATSKAARTLKTALKNGVQQGELKYKRVLPPISLHDKTKRLDNPGKLFVGDVKKTYPAKHRDLWSGQDEFIRTSLFTDLVVELFNPLLSAGEMQQLMDLFKDLSQVRFPTKWSGFKFKDSAVSSISGYSEMQHPTSEGTGIWNRNVSGGTTAHTALDEARAKVVIETINSFIHKDIAGVVTLKPNVTLEEIARAVIVKAGIFTLNYFTGPASAANLEADTTKEEKATQTAAREFWKDKLVELGAPRRAPALPPGIVIPRLDLHAIDRDFRPDLNPGAVSPRRGTALTMTDMYKRWE